MNLRAILVDSGLITEASWTTAEKRAVEETRPLVALLLRGGLVRADQLARLLAHNLGLMVFDLDRVALPMDLFSVVPRSMALQLRVAALAVETNATGTRLYLGMSDPSDQEVLLEVCHRTGMTLAPVLVDDEALARALGRGDEGNGKTLEGGIAVDSIMSSLPEVSVEQFNEQVSVEFSSEGSSVFASRFSVVVDTDDRTQVGRSAPATPVGRFAPKAEKAPWSLGAEPPPDTDDATDLVQVTDKTTIVPEEGPPMPSSSSSPSAASAHSMRPAMKPKPKA
jgi:hypothetical protein